MKMKSLLLSTATAVGTLSATTLTASAMDCQRQNIAMTQPNTELVINTSTTVATLDDANSGGILVSIQKSDAVLSTKKPTSEIFDEDLATEAAAWPIQPQKSTWPIEVEPKTAAAWPKLEKHPALFASILLEDVVDGNGLTKAVSADKPTNFGSAMRMASLKSGPALKSAGQVTERLGEHSDERPVHGISDL